MAQPVLALQRTVADRIVLTLGGDETLLEAVRAHSDYVTGETLAVELSLNGGGGATVAIEGRELLIGVERAG